MYAFAYAWIVNLFHTWIRLTSFFGSTTLLSSAAALIGMPIKDATDSMMLVLIDIYRARCWCMLLLSLRLRTYGQVLRYRIRMSE